MGRAANFNVGEKNGFPIGLGGTLGYKAGKQQGSLP